MYAHQKLATGGRPAPADRPPAPAGQGNRGELWEIVGEIGEGDSPHGGERLTPIGRPSPNYSPAI